MEETGRPLRKNCKRLMESGCFGLRKSSCRCVICAKNDGFCVNMRCKRI